MNTVPLMTVYRADGMFDESREYFFFNEVRREVQSTSCLQRIGYDHLGSLGTKIVAIDKLRQVKDVAIEDGQRILLREIEALKERIDEMELEKTRQSRTMKYRLMAR